jgi:hypothetical protein
LDWIVRRDIDHARIGGLDRNIVLSLLGNRAYFLFRRALQVTGFLRFGAERLDHLGHVCRLVYEGVAQIRGPRQVVIHLRDDGRETREGFHGWIPFHAVDRRKVILCDSLGILFNPAVQLDDVQRISAGRQHLREQGIRIERNSRQQLPELFLVEASSGNSLLGGCRRRCRRSGCARRRSGSSWRCGIVLSLPNRRGPRQQRGE